MKRFLSFFISLLLVLSIPLCVAASEHSVYIHDNAGLLTAQEINSLETESAYLRQEYGFDVAILTLDTLNGNSIEYVADNFYDSNGYSEDGVILVLAMEEREWYISTCGSCIYALTDFGIQKLGEMIVPYLSSGDYFMSFSAFQMELPRFFEAYNSGNPIDGNANYSDDYYHGTREDIVYYEDDSSPNFILSAGIGLAAATIVILIMRGAMNTKRPQASAVSYLKTGSYHLRTHQDLFLYSNVSKIRRQENNSNSGGSSVHRSSSGRSHGGGGGRF